MIYATLFNRRNTPQTRPIPGETQVPNSAGGFVYALDPWARLDRFLVLGSESGTYYASPPGLTQENAVGRTLQEHAAIVDALERRDAALAQALTVAHIAGIEQWLRDAAEAT